MEDLDNCAESIAVYNAMRAEAALAVRSQSHERLLRLMVRSDAAPASSYSVREDRANFVVSFVIENGGETQMERYMRSTEYTLSSESLSYAFKEVEEHFDLMGI